jgi:DNA-binding NarL/FixJ family response regulator
MIKSFQALPDTIIQQIFFPLPPSKIQMMPITELIRVLVFDNESLVRHQLRQLLSMASDISCVGEIVTLPQLSQACLALQPQVLLVGSGLKPFIIDLPALIAQISPITKLIALINPQDTVRTQALLATPLSGCLLRHEIDETLLYAIRAVAHGGTWFSRAVVEQLVISQPSNAFTHEQKNPITQHGLTRREHEVLHLLAQGASNKAIARELSLTEGTIEQHLKRLYRKLNINTRVEATIWFLRFHQ